MAYDTTHREQPDTTDAIDSTVENQRQRLNVATQETRFVLIQNILSSAAASHAQRAGLRESQQEQEHYS